MATVRSILTNNKLHHPRNNQRDEGHNNNSSFDSRYQLIFGSSAENVTAPEMPRFDMQLPVQHTPTN